MSPTAGLTVQQLIDAAPDALVVIDVSGAIVLVNRMAHDLLGYDTGELLGMPFTFLVSTGDTSSGTGCAQPAGQRKSSTAGRTARSRSRSDVTGSSRFSR